MSAHVLLLCIYINLEGRVWQPYHHSGFRVVHVSCSDGFQTWSVNFFISSSSTKKVHFQSFAQDGLELQQQLLLLLHMLIDFVWCAPACIATPGVKHTSGTEWTQWGKQPSKWGSTSSQAKQWRKCETLSNFFFVKKKFAESEVMENQIYWLLYGWTSQSDHYSKQIIAFSLSFFRGCCC